MGKRSELRLHHLNLPDEIVTIARTHRDLPPKARDAVDSAIARYQEKLVSLENHLANLVLPRDYYIRQELREERDGVRETLQACQSLFSTIRRIPFETMGEIFVYYLAPGGTPISRELEGEEEEERDHAVATRFHAPRTAGLLCLVCQHWKTVAIGTPSLWSDIKVAAYHELSENSNYQATPLILSKHTRGLLAWMDRVTSHPWTLTRVDGNQSAMSTNPWDLTGAVPLSQLVHRRASAYISRLSVTTWDCSIGLGKLDCPLITSLVSYNANGASPQPTLLSLPVMPNLMQAVLWTNLPESLPSNIPWSKLTRLFLGGDVVAAQWKSIIRHCTSLQRGMFTLMVQHDIDETYHDFPGPEEVTLRHLKDLAFVRSTPFDAPIEGLFLPALTTLKVFGQWSEPLFNAQPDLFINITHLTLLQHAWMEGEDLVKIFSMMPHLHELLFRVCSRFDAVFDFLTFGREGKFQLRRLKALGIYLGTKGSQEENRRGDSDEEDFEPFPHQQLIDLVDSRTQAINRGDFSASPYTLCELESFVLRLDALFDTNATANKKWMDDTVASVQDTLKSYGASCGLKVSVFGTPKEQYYSVYDFPDLFYLEGRQFHEKRLLHWDEGFADLVDNCEEYSLYPLSP